MITQRLLLIKHLVYKEWKQGKRGQRSQFSFSDTTEVVTRRTRISLVLQYRYGPIGVQSKSLCSNSQYLTVMQLFIAPSGIGHLSLKRKGALNIAENGGSLRRSCEFGSDMLWPPPLESEGRFHLFQSLWRLQNALVSINNQNNAAFNQHSW